MSILDGNDLDEQEWQVQEFINILAQISNLRFFHLRLHSNVMRNWRQVKRHELQYSLENAATLDKQLALNLESA
jgi:uncharacterized membrane protein YciS (DUF1049 family)